MRSIILLAFGWATSAMAAPPVPIDNGNGTYHYALPAGASTATYWQNGVEWTYAGQADFPDNPAAWSVQTNVPGPPDPAVTDFGVGEIVGTIRVDDLGRSWTATTVNMPVIQQAVSAYDQMVDEPYLGGTETLDLAWDPSVVDYDWHPNSFSFRSCSSNPVKQEALWHSDSRALLVPNTREKKTVAIFKGDQHICSGVMIDNDSVLTAAHCVVDANLNLADARHMSVCTTGNAEIGSECSSVRSVVPMKGYAGNSKKDIGVISLNGSHLGTGNWMALSSATASTIRSHSQLHSGYPFSIPRGNICSNNTVAPVRPDTPYGVLGYTDVGATSKVMSRVMRLESDVGGGESGSPAYFYPDGWGGRHLVTGVHSGIVKGYNVVRTGNLTHTFGPYVKAVEFTRVRPYRSWIILNM